MYTIFALSVFGMYTLHSQTHTHTPPPLPPSLPPSPSSSVRPHAGYYLIRPYVESDVAERLKAAGTGDDSVKSVNLRRSKGTLGLLEKRGGRRRKCKALSSDLCSR